MTYEEQRDQDRLERREFAAGLAGCAFFVFGFVGIVNFMGGLRAAPGRGWVLMGVLACLAAAGYWLGKWWHRYVAPRLFWHRFDRVARRAKH